jgi:hypothetical protein
MFSALILIERAAAFVGIPKAQGVDGGSCPTRHPRPVSFWANAIPAGCTCAGLSAVRHSEAGAGSVKDFLEVTKRYEPLSGLAYAQLNERTVRIKDKRTGTARPFPLWRLRSGLCCRPSIQYSGVAGPPCAGPARHQAAQDRPQRRQWQLPEDAHRHPEDAQ